MSFIHFRTEKRLSILLKKNGSSPCKGTTENVFVNNASITHAQTHTHFHSTSKFDQHESKERIIRSLSGTSPVAEDAPSRNLAVMHVSNQEKRMWTKQQ